jgi:hypothetical protein
MADGHGGYRRPGTPGSGLWSWRQALPPHGRRTAGHARPARTPSTERTLRSALRKLSAPMSGGHGDAGSGPAAVAELPTCPGSFPIGAPTQRPEEPVHCRHADGTRRRLHRRPRSIAGMSPHQADRLRSYLPVLVLLASQDDTDPATKQLREAAYAGSSADPWLTTGTSTVMGKAAAATTANWADPAVRPCLRPGAPPSGRSASTSSTALRPRHRRQDPGAAATRLDVSRPLQAALADERRPGRESYQKMFGVALTASEFKQVTDSRS